MSGALRAFLDLPAELRRLGPFQLIRPLGKGGFAPVWLAEEVYGETKLRTAAIKLFAFGELAGNTTLSSSPADGAYGASDLARIRRERVLLEARALCRVEHPNVVRFYALPTDDGRGILGLAMEHVAGTSLDEKLATLNGLDVRIRHGLPLLDVLTLGIAVASALTVVHQAGLVHRDIKPANVIDAGGVYKLIDFGIAEGSRARPKKKREEIREILIGDIPIQAAGTQASMLEGETTGGSSPALASGTFGYIDPACLRESDVVANASSDLYGLGAMLYECVTGRLPALTLQDTGEYQLSPEVLMGLEKPTPLGKVVRDVPPAFASLVDSLLSAERDARPRSAEQVARELERIRQELAGHVRTLPPEEVGPFRGLGRFEEADRDVFFGRGAEIAAGVEVLRARGLLALVGPSGSGKSSLGRAGVVPLVVEGALGRFPRAWDHVVISPGVDPYRTLLTTLVAIPDLAASLAGPGTDAKKSAEDLLADGMQEGPDELVAALGERAETTGRGLILFVDQLEELATISEPVSAQRLVAFLNRIGERPISGLRAVVALRRDLLDPIFALSDEFGRVLSRGTLLVSPMSDGAWADALDQALAAYGYQFEDDALRRTLVADLRETSTAMPLVQFALTQLWNSRDIANKRVTRASYEAIGGLQGALERHAETTLERLSDIVPFAQALTHDVLLALTTAQGTRVVRQLSALIDASGNRAGLAVKHFEDARLLTREPDGYTLAHEALLSQWHRLADWVAEAREDRLLADLIERDGAAWDLRRDPAMLWRKGRLAAAEDVKRHGIVRLSDVAAEFIDHGRRAEQYAARRLIYVVVAMSIALVGSVVALLVSLSRERTNSKVRDAQTVAEIGRDKANREREEAIRERSTIEWDRDQYKATVERMELLRNKAHEDLRLLPDQDPMLAKHCRELRQKALAEAEAPKHLEQPK